MSTSNSPDAYESPPSNTGCSPWTLLSDLFSNVCSLTGLRTNMAVKVPVPGPARLKKSAGPDEWLEAAKNCKYLSEYHMKQLCEIVKEYMMEGMLVTRPNRAQS